MSERPGMTEEEARTRWCPFARSFNYTGVGHDPPVSVNRNDNGGPDEDCRCLASACMAWRSLGEHYDPTKGYFTERGYCGLAGCLEQPR